MSRRPWILCLALCCGAMSRQDGEPDPSQEYQEFVRKVYLRDQRWEKVDKPLAMAKAQKAMAEYQRKVAAGEAVGGGMAGMVLRPPRQEFVATAREKAGRYQGTEHAVPWLAWITSDRYVSDRSALRFAAGTLMLRHLDSPGIGPFARNLPDVSRRLGQSSPLPWLERILAGNDHPLVQASALLARAEVRKGAGAKDAAREDALRAQALAGDDLQLNLQLAELLQDLDQPDVGQVAPEIVGEDLDGEELRLSDYRGKVVLLDFWGDW